MEVTPEDCQGWIKDCGIYNACLACNVVQFQTLTKVMECCFFCSAYFFIQNVVRPHIVVEGILTAESFSFGGQPLDQEIDAPGPRVPLEYEPSPVSSFFAFGSVDRALNAATAVPPIASLRDSS